MEPSITRFIITTAISATAFLGNFVGQTLADINHDFHKSGKVIRQAITTATPQAQLSAVPSPTPTASPSPAATPNKKAGNGSTKSAGSSYTSHSGIATTWFRAGTPAGAGDKGISNVPSAWYNSWSNHLGGVDNGSLPLNRPGKDNLYYAALPCFDYVSGNLNSARVQLAPWYNRTSAPKNGQSIFKNRWLEVSANGKKVYVQWADIGPLYEDDCQYVFGNNRPRMESTKAISSALDISATAFQALESDLNVGVIKTTWRFIDAGQVPDGPWKATVTTQGPDWSR